ncbi:MAG TPA: OmpA family protein [Nitrospirota bacterium]|nr:OmpA family protein [Nitrospirota bacterium]
MKIRRDTPVTEEERTLLARLIASELDFPVDLSVETVPFVPVLVFERGDTAVSAEMKNALLAVEEAYRKDPSIRCRIEAYPETGMNPGKRKALSRRRIENVAEILQKTGGLPSDRIEQDINPATRREPSVKVLVITGGGREEGKESLRP